MNILALMGSPRIGGNTDTLLSELLRGAQSVGAAVEKIVLNKQKIGGCQACDGCRKTGRCRVGDDMQPLYDKLLAADVLVLGTPVYFWGPTAQLKPFVDRWYALDQPGIREKLAAKKLQLVCPFGDTDPATAAPTVDMLRIAGTYMGMEWCEPLLAPGVNDRGEVAHNAALMQRAFDIGVHLGQ